MMTPGPTPPPRDVYSVSRLNREVKALLEGSLPLLWIEGEISNLAKPRSGHLYFTLKDEAAQVRCAMFRMRRIHLPFVPEEGMQVLVRARITLYEPRGDFQLVVEHMEEAGDGLLRRRFEQLKQQLLAEGMFESERKRPLPTLPKRIGVVTSPTGAAIHDILTVLGRRFPAIPVILYPTPVQGAGAAEAIAAAIETAGRRAECDALIVGRGGGSLEDLWAFNEEVLARAIFDSPIPIVSAVGHEVDFTIADFVADQRAPTPSAAAELLSPPGLEWQARFTRLEERLSASMARKLERLGNRLSTLRRRLKHPGRRLQEMAQRLDELERRLHNAQQRHLLHLHAVVASKKARLERHTPLHRLQRLGERMIQLTPRLAQAQEKQLERARQRLGRTSAALETVSPLATLQRGYAIITHGPEQKVVRSAAEVVSGERIDARLGRGRLLCTVDEVLALDNDQSGR